MSSRRGPGGDGAGPGWFQRMSDPLAEILDVVPGDEPIRGIRAFWLAVENGLSATRGCGRNARVSGVGFSDAD